MSQILTKKRTHDSTADDMDRPAKKTKKDESSKTGNTKNKKDKGKSRATDSEFTVVKATLRISIAPVFASNLRVGVEEMLDSMVMRYIPAFRGVVLAHSNLHFLDQTGTIISDCPFLVCNIGFDATVWSPRIGLKLVGQINLCSPDHISLLVHRTFNISIPRHHIPTNEWEFEYGPAENDPDFGPEAVREEAEDTGSQSPEKCHEESGGKWIHRITGERLGGAQGFLEVTVIGLTVANEMLSLLGSIQFDPFSPEHIPARELSVAPEPVSENESVPTAAEDIITNGEEDSDSDPFQRLGKMADEAARAANHRAKKAGVAERKRKRNSDKKVQEGTKRKKI